MPVAPSAPLGSAPVQPERAAARNDADPAVAGGISWRRNLYAITVAQVLAIIGFTLREPILPFYLKQLGASLDRRRDPLRRILRRGRRV
jgi:hypothetical protein